MFAAEIQSLRSGLAADSQAVKAELEKLRSGLAADSQTVRSELEKMARRLAEQANAIAALEQELTTWRRDQVVPTLRRWLGRM